MAEVKKQRTQNRRMNYEEIAMSFEFVALSQAVARCYIVAGSLCGRSGCQ
jgi:hypothetical protein